MSVSRVSDDVRLGYKHPKVQRLRRLISRRDERDTEGVFVAEGYKLLEEGLAAGFIPEATFVAPRHSASRSDAEPTTAGTKVVGPAADFVGRQDDDRIHELEPGVIERVADTVSPQGVIAVFEQRTVSLAEAAAPFVVLVDVRDPGNAGTILRSAEASGVGSAVLTQGSVDVFNPKVVRSSAGAIFNLPIVRDVPLHDLIADLKARGVICIGTVMDAPQAYDQTDLTRPVALFMGNEANGLDTETLALMDENVSIPIEGRSESLNVSMAASVLCFELARQVRNAGIPK